ncbi:MAG: VWA domain-containing protein [Glaciimonas sp.]|nr:VWA domain-containing protein [Glaciimonas sp.]
MSFDFDHPAALALLPLALLPLLRRRKDTLTFSYLAWLPADYYGRMMGWLWRALAVLAIASIVIGLASPGRSGAQLLRSGHGAEVLILMDRSTSMDAIIPKGVLAAGSLSEGESKNMVARELLTQFVTKRPNDRFALTMFSTSVMPVAPFSDHNQAVLAGLGATGIGRGLPNTNMGAALLAAIDEFQRRSYSGSRIILIVSDGGAQLDETTRQRIQGGLSRNRIGLYFIYIRSSVNSPNLNAEIPDNTRATEEVALHRFFLSLPTPYRLYQADDSKAMAAALADINRQQNLPLSFFERVPRQDDSGKFFIGALLACALLLVGRSLQLRTWT